MSLLTAWFVNFVALGLAFLFLRWDIWNPIASFNLLVWMGIVFRKYLMKEWCLPLSGPGKILLAIPLLLAGLTLLISQAPSALWLFCWLHGGAILLSRATP